MEIIIKKKIPSLKKHVDADGIETSTFVLSIYFDVLTSETVYIDNNDIGYFPIEIEAKPGISDTDIIAACKKWLVDNDVLSHYNGKPHDHDDIIQNRVSIVKTAKIKFLKLIEGLK